MTQLFDNYDQLLARVDELCRRIEKDLVGHLTCQAGCGSCCRAITLFPVEAHALRRALQKLASSDVMVILQRLETAAEDECPLLVDERCLLYHARPIICRTHGLPVIYQELGEQRVDCCPKNDLSGLNITGADVIDLDRLNALLVAVNNVYCMSVKDQNLPERLTIAEALIQEKS